MNFEVNLPFAIGNCLPDFRDQVTLNLTAVNENLGYLKDEVEKRVSETILNNAKQAVEKSEILNQLKTCGKNIDEFLEKRRLLHLRVRELEARRDVVCEEQSSTMGVDLLAIQKELSQCRDERDANELAIESSLKHEQKLMTSFRNAAEAATKAVWREGELERREKVAKLGEELLAIPGVVEILGQLVEAQFESDAVCTGTIDAESFLPDSTKSRKGGAELLQFELNRRLEETQKRREVSERQRQESIDRQRANIPPRAGVVMR